MTGQESHSRSDRRVGMSDFSDWERLSEKTDWNKVTESLYEPLYFAVLALSPISEKSDAACRYCQEWDYLSDNASKFFRLFTSGTRIA